MSCNHEKYSVEYFVKLPFLNWRKKILLKIPKYGNVLPHGVNDTAKHDIAEFFLCMQISPRNRNHRRKYFSDGIVS